MSDPDELLSLGASALSPLDPEPAPRPMSSALELAVDGLAPQDSRYLLGEKLGQGASSEVYLLTDRVLSRDLALKRMRPGLGRNVASAFLREARLLATLDHPSIPTVYDYGVDSADRPFVLMQKFDGAHLGQVIRDEGPFRSGPRLRGLLTQLAGIASALHHAHELGLLHLDLKPGNLMTGPFDQLWAVDWGNAIPKQWWHRSYGRPVGTLGFMSPEQARGGPHNPRTDVYGLGACLFSALTGHAPHRGSREARIQRLLAKEPVASPSVDIVARLPPAVFGLAMECMAPELDDRPQSALELKHRLEAALRSADLLPRYWVGAGTHIAREGEAGDTAWVILSGSVVVHQEGRGIVRTLGPGAVVGELAPLLGRPRTATLTAHEDTIVAAITGESLRDSGTMGPMGSKLFRAIAERLLEHETREVQAVSSS